MTKVYVLNDTELPSVDMVSITSPKNHSTCSVETKDVINQSSVEKQDRNKIDISPHNLENVGTSECHSDFDSNHEIRLDPLQSTKTKHWANHENEIWASKMSKLKLFTDTHYIFKLFSFAAFELQLRQEQMKIFWHVQKIETLFVLFTHFRFNIIKK